MRYSERKSFSDLEFVCEHLVEIIASVLLFNAISIGGPIMRKSVTGAAVAILLLAMITYAAGGAMMKITSSVFQEGGNIPSKFTCDGSDTSPPLNITGVPPGAKSLVLIADDPDAPGGLFTHWLIWNIPPQTSSIPEGRATNGVQGTNDFGKSGYRGPCPPPGTHRYSFKIFALDRELDLGPGAKRSQVDAAMKGHVIAHGELIGRYARKK
jgi:Raf kinase inhibitor-like YbhB/YbcL family protein